MELHSLLKTTTKSKRIVGRGHGSGRAKTAGRGTKGQKARRTIPLHFEGGALPLIKRLPFRRGKGRNFSPSIKPLIINLDVLELLPANSIVTLELLVKALLVDLEDAKVLGVKILGNGELTKNLTVKLPTSKNAQQKIEKAGGKVEN